MHVILRCLLWMLMAALPLQGSAAVFATCQAQAPAARQACHEQAVGKQAKGSVKAHGKCGTCASCCTAATAPPHSVALPAPFLRAVRAPSPPEPAIAAVVPAVPERPPRMFS